MIHSVHAKRLEFDNVILDLNQVQWYGPFTESYIIFLNVKCAFYKNFHVSCNMSMETLALHVYENAVLTVDGAVVPRDPNFAKYISFNATDFDQSMVLDFVPHARIVVAKQLHINERYHQRVSGFLDFQKRHERQIVSNDLITRNKLDRDLEIKLYNDACE